MQNDCALFSAMLNGAVSVMWVLLVTGTIVVLVLQEGQACKCRDVFQRDENVRPS